MPQLVPINLGNATGLGRMASGSCAVNRSQNWRPVVKTSRLEADVRNGAEMRAPMR